MPTHMNATSSLSQLSGNGDPMCLQPINIRFVWLCLAECDGKDPGGSGNEELKANHTFLRERVSGLSLSFIISLPVA